MRGVSTGSAVPMAFRQPLGSLRVTDDAPERATAAQVVEQTAASGPPRCGLVPEGTAVGPAQAWETVG